ncbi:HTH-type transcriptional regulator HdfR [secondary endosymbiont of Ctenarytaina eucalypti]|uniref:HTH-type transcriptional regulator HdfR n=1 Tax=secondary endosymbiont of Ctenarytaina eucalypti TaxID=1199245 RepID=J3TWT0_9ENTR|nr:HTH-type transcriptional regulator HdfR [secondary endosymbiont of Ctenarytaina eucalypti]AFP84455.1 transcriptional regulator [secondary endosymbiont of Ctenarytaina eucalypti]
MDTELLKTFLEVSRTRHFGRAAEALYLTQSAVSFRIRQLENQLGVSVFTRHRNNIRLTAAGERLLPYAENLMMTWHVAKQEVIRSLQHNTLSIGASASLWEAWLVDWLRNLYKQWPDLQLEARVALRQGLIKELHERQLDLLITTEAPKMEELTSQQLGCFSLTLFANMNSNEPVKNRRPYIQLEWGADFHTHENRLQLNQHAPLVTTTSAQLTRQLLQVTTACAFLPSHWASRFPDLRPVSDVLTIMRPLYAVWLQSSDQRPMIRELLKTVVL